MLRLLTATLLILLGLTSASVASAEDGYDLWLRFRPVEAAALARYQPQATMLVADGRSPTLDVARAELSRGFEGLLGRPLPQVPAATADGAILIGTPRSSPAIAALDLPLSALGAEGYLIRSIRIDGRRATVIAANSDVGALYGAFHLLRLVQTRQPIDALDLTDRPLVERRLLNHWDNLDRTVERGYAGLSLWDWQTLPDFRDPRYTDYARANASIGINGTVVNNVNSNADILRPDYLERVAVLADLLRPYGIRVYLSVRFNAPMAIGGLPTADPLDPRVAAWWRAKADEIYARIPDFGGFLVKANSEGQPGPQDYHRTHADGANMLADAVAPHGGIVMWRAFVYAPGRDIDRAAQAYGEFQPLDGRFRENVIIQVKNGPIDFQPREPFSPLFGAMPQTAMGLEVQLTKEYLGFNTHLVYLGQQWQEVLDADTGRAARNATVADVVDGTLRRHAHSLMAGVANIGNDRNWTGSQFDQANWYAFGRLAWNPRTRARDIAGEWAGMTWGNDPALVRPIVDMMIGSRQAVVDYMTPLGLVHLMATGHHYGPGPWVADLERPDWNPVYFHRADRNGIGFDRTAGGSNSVAQYAPSVARRFAGIDTVGEDYLLYFHHVPWDHRMASGRTLWDELVRCYDRGVADVAAMRRQWAELRPLVDPRRHAEVSEFLAIQQREAQWWRDASIAYFQSISQQPLPAGVTPPPHDVDYYRAIRTPYAPGHH